jgi:hypothetical protein
MTTKQQTERENRKVKTQRQLRLSDIDALKTLLEQIWALGDRDEMSIKHIGHGLAALVTWRDWRDGLDYDLPGMDLTDKQLEQLGEYWQGVTEFLHGVTREELISVFSYLPIAVYGAHYLELFSDYYKEPAAK